MVILLAVLVVAVVVSSRGCAPFVAVVSVSPSSCGVAVVAAVVVASVIVVAVIVVRVVRVIAPVVRGRRWH